MTRNEKTRALFLSVLMVLSVFGGAVALTGSAAAADGGDGLVVQNNHNPNAMWSLDNPNLTVDQGDIARFDVSFNDTNSSQAYLVIGNQTAVGYEANITISDDPTSSMESGTILFNTYEAGNNTDLVDTVTATGGIQIDSVDEIEFTSGPLDIDESQGFLEYPVRFGTVSLAQAYTAPNTTGALNLTERGQDVSINTWTAPASNVSDLESASAQQIQNMAAGGMLTDRNTIARNDEIIRDWDALVYQIKAPGIQGYLQAQGQGSTEAGMAATDALTLTQQDTFFNTPPKQLLPSENASGVTVKYDAEDDMYFVVLDVDDVNLVRDTNSGIVEFGPPQKGETYDVRFTVQDDIGTQSAAATGNEGTSFINAPLNFRSGNLNDFDNDGNEEYEIRTRSQFSVGGSTELAPGTQFSIRLFAPPQMINGQSAGDIDLMGQTAVADDGSFNVDYSLGMAPTSGVTFTLFIESLQGNQVTLDGRFRAQPTANVTFNDQTVVGGDLVVVDSGDLSDGGFIAIHQGSPGGPIVGSSKLLRPGSFNDVLVALDQPVTSNATLYAMPHFDRNDNGFFDFPGADIPYNLSQPVPPSQFTEPRPPITDAANITYVNPNRTPTPRNVTVIRTKTIKIPQDVTRTVIVPRTRTVFVEEPVTVTRIVDRTVVVNRTVVQTVFEPVVTIQNRTVTVIKNRTVERTVPVVTERTVTVIKNRTVFQPVVTNRTVTVIKNRTVTDSGGQPGLGVVVAVIALLAAALLAARRRSQ